MPSNAAEDSSQISDRIPGFTGLVGCGVIVLSVLVLTLVFAFFYTMFRAPLLSTLYHAQTLTTFFANLVVVFYAFPAFTRTRDRSLFCIAFAALLFGYGALFTMVLGVGPPATAWRIARAEVQWYYATRYATAIVGLVLYSYGLASLIRRTQTV